MRTKIDFLKDIEADFIGTQLPHEAGAWLYADCTASRVIPLPHALNPDTFKPVVPNPERPIDIGARSHRYWSCLGDNERNDLYFFFSTHEFAPSLTVDIDTQTRYDRSGWVDFLNRCKGTISNEAGSYYLQRDDAIVKDIMGYVEIRQRSSGVTMVRPDSGLERLWRLVPKSLKHMLKTPLSRFLKSVNVTYYSDAYEQLDFSETFERFFKDAERCPVYSKAISSRHFDAIGTKTCQIMLRGRFNDIIEPDEHYICLEHDFSNVDDVMRRFRDDAYRQNMVDSTYEYIMDSHTYRHRVALVRDLIQHHDLQ
ncbi:MAG: hypothetical protein ACP5G0_04940 [Desulfomonilia bacterium]